MRLAEFDARLTELERQMAELLPYLPAIQRTFAGAIAANTSMNEIIERVLADGGNTGSNSD